MRISSCSPWFMVYDLWFILIEIIIVVKLSCKQKLSEIVLVFIEGFYKWKTN